MSYEEMKKKLHDYIEAAEPDQLYEMNSFVSKHSSNHWNDPQFVKEMNRRVEDIKSGKTSGYTMEESLNAARKILDRIKQ